MDLENVYEKGSREALRQLLRICEVNGILSNGEFKDGKMVVKFQETGENEVCLTSFL